MMRSMLVANDGGHLAQLRALAGRLDLLGAPLWVTVRTPQTVSLLAGEDVRWVGPAPTRDWRAAWRNTRLIRPLFQTETIGEVISTGSSLALSALPQARLRRIPAHYIESVTRTEGVSVSGRVLSHVPGVHLYVQWPHLEGGRWRFSGSVLDGFTVHAIDAPKIRRMVVSLGTSSRFGFRRLLERLVAITPPGIDVLWQTGSTDTAGLGIAARASVPSGELTTAIRQADATIAHAGAGIALTILESGKVPVLIPRRAEFGEHIDDHQEQIAGRLAEHHLAIVASVEDLDWQHVTNAAGLVARRADGPPPFALVRSS